MEYMKHEMGFSDCTNYKLSKWLIDRVKWFDDVWEKLNTKNSYKR